ncbi:LysR family transcriptional regulator [Dasania sp. GY-MA-18]|uniref:LysR family transcriptional regulator n=1 Tax=Dasania phycosphaerae TaxID=2950436 RepID=A0A9J6RN22_9GAMM|nr:MULTISPECIES: LysR family transcriptional regulator [Dasania]MCR8922966.1 LysR family transcriptional regulator [Dasania sp. GY-MA-18]MCZ0865397.1 LysR family transcriptional regulator [Dasania phycosphaerae]MCZ0869122.1 LysR family transcriptional regulator [Dasania phycosphaerae]
MVTKTLGQLSDVDLRLLRVFRVVAESGGISAAEVELNIGRSTISRHLKDLEIRLGVVLCRRGRSGFALTEEGQLIYKASLRLLAAMDEFRGEVNDVHQQMTGNIGIALFDKTVTNPQAAISTALRLFEQAAPKVVLELFVEPLNEIERGILDGRFQVGVVPFQRSASGIHYEPLFKEQMYLYCGRQHSFWDEELVTESQILAAKYAGLGYMSPNMQIGQQLNMQRSATGYDQEAIATLILSGCYLGYLPDHYAKQFVERGLMKSVGENTFQYLCEFSAAYRLSPKPSRVVDTFIQCLRQAHQLV